MLFQVSLPSRKSTPSANADEANCAIEFTIMGIPEDLHLTADYIPTMLKHQE
jgi:hypothetical protein